MSSISLIRSLEGTAPASRAYLYLLCLSDARYGALAMTVFGFVSNHSPYPMVWFPVSCWTLHVGWCAVRVEGIVFPSTILAIPAPRRSSVRGPIDTAQSVSCIVLCLLGSCLCRCIFGCLGAIVGQQSVGLCVGSVEGHVGVFAVTTFCQTVTLRWSGMLIFACGLMWYLGSPLLAVYGYMWFWQWLHC